MGGSCLDPLLPFLPFFIRFPDVDCKLHQKLLKLFSKSRSVLQDMLLKSMNESHLNFQRLFDQI